MYSWLLHMMVAQSTELVSPPPPLVLSEHCLELVSSPANLSHFFLSLSDSASFAVSAHAAVFHM